MTDRVLLGASIRTFHDCLALASQFGLGLEIQAFAYPAVLATDWKTLLSDYKRMLATFKGELAMHGPFIDMAAGSADTLIRDVVRERILTALETASELNAPTVVFHANFLATMRNIGYRTEFHHNQLEFWPSLADRAAMLGVRIVLENMWEFDPYIIRNVLAAINHPALCACLDVGHAVLFSDAEHSIAKWIEVMTPWLNHVHINNNPGTVDEHHALDDGMIDYAQVLPLIRALANPPTMTLEMYEIDAMRDSLRFLDMAQPVSVPKR